MDAERTPVIVGVGQVNDRPADPSEGLNALELMAEALRRADADAGGGWLAACDDIATVDQISAPELDAMADRVGDALGLPPGRRETTELPHGDSPTRLLNAAANRIGEGETRVAAVVGGEALRTAIQRARAAPEGGRDVVRGSPKRTRSELRTRYGLTAPVDMYPLYENALRARWGQSLEEGQAESAVLWSRLAEVAAANPNAWLREGASPERILDGAKGNRWLSFPYRKLMVANASVNQGAGFLVTSLAEAERRGVADRAVHVGHGAGAHESKELMERDRFDHSPSLEAALLGALDANGLSAADLDHVEFYSCFPCVPKMARRVLGWPLERPTTVFGGLTFGGAALANYMGHAIVSMVEVLRGTDARGLLFANGGIVTSHHAIVLSGAPLPHARFPQDFDRQADADRRRGAAPPLDPEHAGAVEVETYTVHFDRDAPRLGVVVARTPEGARTLAHVPPEDTATIAALMDGTREPVGRRGEIGKGERTFAFAD